MKKMIRIALLTLAVSWSTVGLRAELAQVIRVNVMSLEEVKVDGESVAMGGLTDAVARLVRGDRRVRVEIYAPLGMRRSMLKKIMDSCRKAGASSFRIGAKA